MDFQHLILKIQKMVRICFIIVHLFSFLSCKKEIQKEVVSIEMIKIGLPEKVRNTEDLLIKAGASWYYKIDLIKKDLIIKNRSSDFGDSIDFTIPSVYYKVLLSDSLLYNTNRMLAYIKNLNTGPIKNTYFEKDEYPYYSGGEYILNYEDEFGNVKFHSFLHRNLPTEIENWYQELKNTQNQGTYLKNTFINTDSITQCLIEKLGMGERTFMPRPKKEPILFVSPNKINLKN